MSRLVITPCGARKRPVRTRADQLYTGPYFTACMRYARALAPLDRIRILSAMHGLVPCDRQLDPYSLRFGMPGAVTVDRLRAQAAEQGLLDTTDVVILGGKDYTSRALTVWPRAQTPLAQVKGGMGNHMQALSRWTREAQAR